jgi:gliding motility-associated-like protein
MLLPLLCRLKLVPRLVLLLLALGAARPAWATHLLGGEMSYQYLDANGPNASEPFRYQVTVTVYFNGLYTPGSPNGIAAPPNTVNFSIFNRTTGAPIKTVVASRTTALGRPVYPRVPSGCTVSGPSQPYYLLKYTQVVTLPATADGYYAVFTLGARNNTLTNINNPTNVNVPLTLYVSMAPPLIYNRAPVFSDTAVAIVCANDTTVLLNNAVDADGDRLVYSFGTPYGAQTSSASFPPLPQPVPYKPGFGYSGLTPFGTGAGNFALINASTGTAKYGATTQGLYGVAVDVGEYRTINGREVLIGTTRRDLQLVVSTCPPTQAPVLPSVAATPRSYTIEEGQALSILLTATQADGHPLTLTLNSVLLDGAGGYNATFNGSAGVVVAGNPTGTASATGSGSVSGTFVFNSTCGLARTTPYDVAFTVKDNGCAGKTVADVLRITVVRPGGPTAIVGPQTVCTLNTPTTYSATGGTAASVRWRAVGGTFVNGNTGSSVQVSWTTAGTGTLVAKGVSTYGCPTDSVTQTIAVAPAPALTVTGNLTICQGSSTTLAVSGAGTTYTIAGGPATGSGPFVVSPSQTTTYTITSTLLTGSCPSVAQVTVTVLPRPAADAIMGPQSVCPTVTGIAYTIQNPVGTSYQWTVVGGTIASGQGTAAITIDWAAASTGSVSAVTTNSQGCASLPATLPVLINQVLQTVKPSGPTSVCQADGPYSYSTPAVNGSSFAWQLAGSTTGVLTSTGNTTSISFSQPGLAKLVVTQTSNPTGGICRGVSDTLYITVKPSPATTLAIQGPARFCVDSGPQTYTLAGAAGSTYVFQLNGTTLASTGGTATVPASTAAGTYTLTARETNASGCAGPLYSKTFTVDPRPDALTITGPRFVCPSSASLTYTVANAPASSTYQWAVAGGTITAGQGTASITVTFAAGTTTNKTVSVTETSQYGCAGAAVALTVVPDNAQAPQLTLASVVPTDNTKVALTFSVASPATTPNPVRVLRREAGSTGAFAQVGTVAATATTYIDATATAAQTAYEYSLALTNGCDDVFTAPATATTVLLKALASPGPGGRNQGSVALSWSAYQGFAVAGYRLYRQDDNAGYNLVATLSGSTYQYSLTNTGQGFSQCFRVVAFSGEATPRESNSNTACVEFASKTAFYNIITPNNDGQNDKLEIDNVQLYPGNSLTIFNRWGREVFATTNYNNTSNYWGTDPSIAAGVYYYLFKLADGTSTKGWVEVVK